MRPLIALAALALAGCVGPLVEHVRIDQATVPTLSDRVKVLTEEQSKARNFAVLGPVTATSCKNKLWDPAPTNDDATNQLRVKASSLGADALANLYCETPQGTSLATNCWSSIVCHAAAVKLGQPQQSEKVLPNPSLHLTAYSGLRPLPSAGELKRQAAVDKERFPQLLRSIYEAVDELERMFPGRHFTPDGHLVGSLGEALASFHYGVALNSASTECHDGTCGGLQVQVKATQGDRIALSSEPEHLLVLRLERDGSFTEEYNGPGMLPWSLVGHKPRPKNGQYQVSLAALRRLMSQVDEHSRLPRIAA